MKILLKFFFPVRPYWAALILHFYLGLYVGLIPGACLKFQYLGFLGWFFSGPLLVVSFAFILYALEARRRFVAARKREREARQKFLNSVFFTVLFLNAIERKKEHEANMARIRATRANSRTRTKAGLRCLL